MRGRATRRRQHRARNGGFQMGWTRIAILLVTGFSLLFAEASVALPVTPPPPDVNPADFDPRQTIDNLFFPLPARTKFVYEGIKGVVVTRDEMCVTKQTKLIEGVVITVVHDRSFEGGVLVEDTVDWFAQDVFGNVWYFGEDTTEIQSGSKAGSFEAGVNGARAGFIMLANPQVGDRYYQEFALNVAEDQATVVSRNESVCLTSGACYDNVLKTKETSRLDPGAIEYKFYAPTVGFILGV